MIYSDTDSLVYSINHDDAYKEDKATQRTCWSVGYNQTRYQEDNTNKQVIGKWYMKWTLY